jgi:hypothetical protein
MWLMNGPTLQNSRPDECVGEGEPYGRVSNLGEDDAKGDHCDAMGSEYKDTSLSDFEIDGLSDEDGRSNSRIVAVHYYKDHLNDPFFCPSQQEREKTGSIIASLSSRTSTGSLRQRTLNFPEKLHLMLRQLENEGRQHVCRRVTLMHAQAFGCFLGATSNYGFD